MKTMDDEQRRYVNLMWQGAKTGRVVFVEGKSGSGNTTLAVLLAVRGNWITKYSKVDQYSLFIMIAAVNLTANLLIMYYS